MTLSPGGSVIVGSNTVVTGSTGVESITVIPNSTNIVFDRDVEKIILPGNIGDYTFGKNGDELYIFKNGVVVARGLIQTDADGTQLTFGDGTVNVTLSGGSMYIGGTAVTGTSTSPSPVVPATINTSVTTGTPVNVTGGTGGTGGTTPTTLFTVSIQKINDSTLSFDNDFGTKYPNMRITSVWGIH